MRVALFLFFAAAACAPAQVSEREAVVATVQRLFDAMETRDSAAALAVLVPGGSYVSVREKAGAVSAGTVSHKDFAARLEKDKTPIREVMRNPQVLIHGRVAALWTPYEFYRDGKISHCGVDSFNLVKTAEGWKIAGFVYNIEPCAKP